MGLGKAGAEANQSKKKGRKQHDDSVEDLKRLVECIQRRGEASPGDLAKELGMSRSTLTYNLKRLLNHSTIHIQTSWSYRYTTLYCILDWLLGSKMVERLGKGNNVRYRIMEPPTTGRKMKKLSTKFYS